MVWHRTDDGFPEHPKADALAEHFGDDWQTLNLAFALWHHMGCDCAARRTDGVFNAPRAYRVMRAPREAIDRAVAGLLKVGLLERRADCLVFHDWADYQPTRAQLDAEREAKTARQQRWREGRASKDVDAKETAERRGVDGAVDASTRPSVDASRDGAVDAAPSRPVPTRPDHTQNSPSGSAEGATAPAPPASAETAYAAHTTSTGSEPTAAKPTRARRAKPTPQPDTIPAPNTLARRVYDAILSDAALRPITGNPGDAAERWADPATFPGVDVLAEVKRAGDYASTKPGRYTDGRAFLRGWLQRKADEHAAQPKPATTASATRPAALPPNDLQIRLRAMREEQARKDAANGR